MKLKVMKTDEFEDAIYYRYACDCSNSDCDLTLELEQHDDYPHIIFLNMYKKLAWCSNWGDLNIFQRIWKKIKATLKILFTGYIDIEECLVIRGEEHINSLITALEEGKNKMKGKINEKENN